MLAEALGSQDNPVGLDLWSRILFKLESFSVIPEANISYISDPRASLALQCNGQKLQNLMLQTLNPKHDFFNTVYDHSNFPRHIYMLF